MDYAKLIEKIKAAKIKERMSFGVKGDILEGVDCSPHLESGRSRDIVGAKIGMSGRQYTRAKYIAENAPPEIIKQLDKGEQTITGAYKELRAKEKSETAPKIKIQGKQLEPASVNMPEEHDISMDLRVQVYDELSKIHELIANFEITSDRMEALRDNFEDTLTARKETEHIYKSIDKLNKLVSEIYYRAKSGHTTLADIFKVKDNSNQINRLP